MGLFSRRKDKIGIEIDFDKTATLKSLVSMGPDLHEYREDPGTRAFASYVNKLLNLEVLNLASDKEINAEAYAYRRGRIDSLRELIARREKYLLDEKEAAKGPSESADHKAKRSFIRKQSSAGLSI